MKPNNQGKGANTLDEIKKLEQKRQQRRQKMEDMKKQKQQKKAYNLASGKNVDIDFELMIQKNRFDAKMLQNHTSSTSVKLSVCVRKRPLFKKQEQNGQIDAISCANPQIKIHQPKYKVDGITKYIDNHIFTFDNTFNEEQSNEDIYRYSLKPLIPTLIQEGVVTCFAYGQTGSGKTHTMNGIQQLVVHELFDMLNKRYSVYVSFFEIYGGRCLDLLNEKNLLTILEDKNNNIQIQGLVQKTADNSKQLFQIMQLGNSNRTTHATVANDTSSRSHSICQIVIKSSDQNIIGKLVLVDLAGSQRAQDTQSNNRQRRIQGAQINKSLLALKECIRAMDEKADHVPFRAAKLTLVLRDSFINRNNKCKVVMIACISPGTSSTDHSLNTLRYADRLKDRTGQKLSQIEQIKLKNQDQPLPKINSYASIKKQQQKQTKPVQSAVVRPPQIPNPNKKFDKETKLLKKQEKIVLNKVNEKNSDRNSSMNRKQGINNKSMNGMHKQISKQKQQIQQQIENEVNKVVKYKAKDDVRAMKQTMKYDKKQEFFDFHQKVSNILNEQQQIFATHMASIKQDAKLLAQESELISNAQTAGFLDYDVDTYVQKLESVIKKKLKIYNLLAKKIENFKKNLKEEDQIRQKVKDTFYY